MDFNRLPDLSPWSDTAEDDNHQSQSEREVGDAIEPEKSKDILEVFILWYQVWYLKSVYWILFI